MDVLDIPRRLLSMLPFVGGSDEPDRPTPAATRTPPPSASATTDRAPATAESDDPFDDPDEVEEVEEDEEDEEDQEDEEADEPDDDELGADDEEDEADDDEDEPDGSDVEPAADESEDDEPETVDISGTTAPSIGPNTVIEKIRPEDRLARSEQSDIDAMGQDKRRSVIGGSYSASFAKQLVRWALVIVVIAAAGFGAKLLVDDLDKAPSKAAERAPWTDNEQQPATLE